MRRRGACGAAVDCACAALLCEWSRLPLVHVPYGRVDSVLGAAVPVVSAAAVWPFVHRGSVGGGRGGRRGTQHTDADTNTHSHTAHTAHTAHPRAPGLALPIPRGSCRPDVEWRGTSLALAPPPRVCGEACLALPHLPLPHLASPCLPLPRGRRCCRTRSGRAARAEGLRACLRGEREHWRGGRRAARCAVGAAPGGHIATAGVTM